MFLKAQTRPFVIPYFVIPTKEESDGDLSASPGLRARLSIGFLLRRNDKPVFSGLSSVECGLKIVSSENPKPADKQFLWKSSGFRIHLEIHFPQLQMASLNPIRNAKKQTIRVDVAPMVDLALLLVIFFMVTLSLNRPKVLLLTMPAIWTDEGIIEHCDANITTTLILEAGNRVFCYHGVEIQSISVTNYSPGGLRKILAGRIADANRLDRDVIFIIKPTDGASYENLVDVLDEMKIAGAKIYAIQPVYSYDQEIVGNYRDRQSTGG